MVILRKYHGKLEAFLGQRGGTLSAPHVPARSIGASFLFHPLVLALLLLALLVLWAMAHPATLVATHTAAPLLGVMGNAVRIRELREKRATTITSARSILDKAEVEKRELTGEERSSYDAHLAEEGKLSDRIKVEERQLELDRSLAGDVIPAEQRGTQTPPASGQPVDARAAALQSAEYRGVFDRWLANGDSAFRTVNEAERRALDATGGPQGGFLQAPIQFAQELIKFMDNLTFVRQRATKVPVTVAKALGIASLDNDPADADWTAEIATGGEDSTMSVGNREMVPHPSAKLIKVSNKLIRVTAGGAETLVRERLGYKFGITEEKAFLTGSGVNQALGAFTASSSGIDTNRDVSAGNTAIAVTFDGLIAAKYSLKAQYHAKAAWAFSRTLVQNISQLKDGEGQYIWKLSVREGEPDRVLGLPFFMSEYVPAVFTTGKYVAVIGDWSYYWIADALAVEIQRLDQLFAGTNQTGFIGRMELDAQPVLGEAFARVKLA